ncbi:hypothetical protein [Streptomyces sp. bgisy060]|uniref:hypothetical protein n=1 Tax=Streptomyces sp. bgisy060 TaxID=3413775 RepID=UPI003EB79993
MEHAKLTAETARGTRDILRSALAEINAAMLRRHPGDYAAQHKALDLPLRMTIHLDVDDKRVPTQTLTAETARGAKDILNAALEQIQAEKLRRHPGNTEAQHKLLEEPMRTWVHFDLADLDREGPLSIDECVHLPHSVPKGLPPSADRRPGRIATRAVPAPKRQLTRTQRLVHRALGL